MTKGIESHLD